MKQSIALNCPQCHTRNEFTVQKSTPLVCPQCKTPLGDIGGGEDIFEQCPGCSCKQFYISKDFNQFVGCSIMVCGIILVPFTYGLSLPIFALIDWLLYKRVPSIINCYRCGCEFKGFEKELKRFKPFLHHIGLKYDKYR